MNKLNISLSNVTIHNPTVIHYNSNEYLSIIITNDHPLMTIIILIIF